MNTTVKVDGENRPDIKCFAVKSGFDGRSADILVLWIPSPDRFYQRDIIMVDRDAQAAGIPNSGDEDYYLLWSFALFQSDNGSRFVRFTDAKFDKNDPRYEFRDEYIGFVEPKDLSGKERKFSIILNR